MGKGKASQNTGLQSSSRHSDVRMSGVSEQQAKVCFARLAAKMPVKVRLCDVDLHRVERR